MNQNDSTRISITLTPEETRRILMERIERSLTESGVSLSSDIRERIAACLPVEAAEAVAAPSQPGTSTSRPYRPASDSRAKAYRPTNKAKPVAQPTSTADTVLNLIVRSNNLCTMDDLTRGTRKPAKAIYNALWKLKNEGLIDSEPLAAVNGKR